MGHGHKIRVALIDVSVLPILQEHLPVIGLFANSNCWVMSLALIAWAWPRPFPLVRRRQALDVHDVRDR